MMCVSLFKLCYFLILKTYKALKEQEKQAQSQLYALWEACETQRRKLAELKKAIEYKKRTEALNIALKTQVSLVGGNKSI